MPRITVEGRATRFQPAERGTATLTVAFSGDSRPDVLGRAGAVHSRLVESARQAVASGAATWWGADGVTAWTYDEWVKPTPHQDAVKVRRFRAGAAVRVKFRDFGALSTWVTDAAQHPGVSVPEVEWALTEVTRTTLTRQVRGQAATDARARAADYAAALGLGDLQLVGLYEEGLRPHVGRTGGPALGSVRGAPPAGAGAGGFELRPDDIEITASVTADFETA